MRGTTLNLGRWRGNRTESCRRHSWSISTPTDLGQDNRPSDAAPIDVAVATLGVSTASPEKAALDLLDLLDCLPRLGMDEHLVNGD